MRVHLINESALPDKPLEVLLQHAAVAAHCRGPVAAVVKRGGYHQHGRAKRASSIKSRVTGRWVNTNCGFIEVWPMTRFYNSAYDYLTDYQWFFQMLIHEFAHVRDFQKGKKFGQYRRRWKNRPHERRAVNAERRGVQWIGRRPDRQVEVDEAILALAIHVEEAGKKREAARKAKQGGESMINSLRLVRIDGRTYVQNSDPKGNFTIHDPSDGETISDLGNATIYPVKGGPVVSYQNGDADDFWKAFDRLRNAADKMVLKYAGALGHTVVVIGTNDRGERHTRVESCDLKRSLAEAKADETVYQRTAKGWRRVKKG